jgi:hypothetical protein
VTSFAVVEILVELVRHGVRVEADGDRLRCADHPALTAELRARIVRNKPELLPLFSATRGPTHGCWNCRRQEFVRVAGSTEFFCANCYPPGLDALIVDRWTAPGESFSPTTTAPKRDRGFREKLEGDDVG